MVTKLKFLLRGRISVFFCLCGMHDWYDFPSGIRCIRCEDPID